MQMLELLYATFRAAHLETGSARAHEWHEFRAREGEQLRRHALFEALQEHFHRADPDVWGWPLWPEPYRDPGAPVVAQFCRDHLARVEFYEWLQWQCDRQLQGVGLRAYELGLGVGLYGDLAVSIDRGGAEAWANQDLYALDAGVGAPPDHYNPAGQNWGLPPLIPERLRTTGYAPFIATLRANMRHTGALRVDHVMGLMRLYWIPEGMPNAQGAYVHYPLHDLLGILALESQRNQCMVIGEDLGTVPDEMRQAHARLRRAVLPLVVLRAPRRRRLQGARRVSRDGAGGGQHARSAHAGGVLGRPRSAAAPGAGPVSERARRTSSRSWSAHRTARACCSRCSAKGCSRRARRSIPPPRPEMTPELMRAVHGYLARTPAKVLMVQLEDVLGVLDQVNVPGHHGSVSQLAPQAAPGAGALARGRALPGPVRRARGAAPTLGGATPKAGRP